MRSFVEFVCSKSNNFATTTITQDDDRSQLSGACAFSQTKSTETLFFFFQNSVIPRRTC